MAQRGARGFDRERRAFGKAILDNQAVHFRLAELKTEVEALRAQIAWRDGAISRLNELVREDERIIEALSAANQSMKSELAVRAVRTPIGLDGMTWRHAVPDIGLDAQGAPAAEGQPGAGIGRL